MARAPVKGTYRGYEILSMPPPSSGGVNIVQILNILEGFPIGFLGPNGADTIHLMAEAMKLAYADRSEYLGDSDFVHVPVAGLTSKSYAAELRKRIDLNRATPSATIKPGDPAPYESDQTTHFSVVDKDGNAVANTYTINFSYGTGLVAEGTGILLNNEMDDFSAKPGVPNAYGLIGGDANAVEPGKRPLSSMSPTIVLKDGKVFLVTGSPGGSRIITTVLQVIMNVIDHGMNIAEATAAPRIHHQGLPDELRVEEGLSPDTLRLLAAKGHVVKVQETMGSTQSIMRREDGALFGASDPRQPTGLTAGY
jgi:gamma-glutamyltranspeptidase/glutathione hydrolase